MPSHLPVPAYCEVPPYKCPSELPNMKCSMGVLGGLLEVALGGNRHIRFLKKNRKFLKLAELYRVLLSESGPAWSLQLGHLI